MTEAFKCNACGKMKEGGEQNRVTVQAPHVYVMNEVEANTAEFHVCMGCVKGKKGLVEWFKYRQAAQEMKENPQWFDASEGKPDESISDTVRRKLGKG